MAGARDRGAHVGLHLRAKGLAGYSTGVLPGLSLFEKIGYCKKSLENMVLPVRIELTTSPLPRGCSTTELRQQALMKSDIFEAVIHTISLCEGFCEESSRDRVQT